MVRMLIALLIGGLAVLTVTLSSVDSLGFQGWQASVEEVQEPTTSRTPHELPREWRWERKAITFDHMFMNRDSDRR
jgi:hypothetical protein